MAFSVTGFVVAKAIAGVFNKAAIDTAKDEYFKRFLSVIVC